MSAAPHVETLGGCEPFLGVLGEGEFEYDWMFSCASLRMSSGR